MGHNLATDIFTMILIFFSGIAVAVPLTIGAIFQYQKNQNEKMQGKNK